MKNLGSLIVLLFFAVAVQAGVTANINKPKVQKGEHVTLTLAVSGEKYTEPEITTLCNTAQIERDYRRKLDSSEGTFREVDLYSYRFAVNSDCFINPILIEVDGVQHYTSAFAIEVRDKLTEGSEDTVVRLSSSSIAPYVGEVFELVITVEGPDTPARNDIDFVPPVLKDLWIKKVYDVPPYQEGAYKVKKRLYRVTPQKAGPLHIDPVEVKIANDEEGQDAWGNPKTMRSWESHYTKALDLDVQPIPDDVHVVGDFSIAMHTDAVKVDAGTPLKVALVVQGRGNFEDIHLVPPAIEGVQVVAEEPLLENTGEEGQERLRQRLVFISDHSFVIPAVRLAYFDLKEKRIKHVYTKAVAIEVLGHKTKPKDDIKEGSTSLTTVWRTGIFIILLFLAILSGMYYRKRTAKKHACLHNSKEALRLLLRHKDEDGVNEMVESLERHIYGRGKEEIDLKKLKALCKKYA